MTEETSVPDDSGTVRDTIAISSLDESRKPSEAVLESVATVEDCQIKDLPPLYDSIDPDALNGLLMDCDSTEGKSVQITFEYCGYDIMVDSQKGVFVTERPGKET